MVAKASPPSDPTAELAAAYTAETAAADQIPINQRQPTLLWRLLSAWLVAIENWLRSHGGTPLRRVIQIFWALIALGGIALLVGPIINPPLTLEDITKSAQTETDRWIARDFDAHYTIGKDAHGQLVAHVTERIDAFFPTNVDESGIRRTIATDYEGNSLNPTGITATLDGTKAPIGRNTTPTELTLSVDAGHRLSGDHTIVIRYELHNLAYVTPDDATGKTGDYLRWDVFGPSWPQAFASLKVSITMPTELSDRLIRRPRGEVAYLIVGAGEWLTPDTSVPGEVSYGFSDDQNIPPHANAGFIMSFTSGTFTMPQHDTLWWIQTFGPLLPLLVLVVSFLLSLGARAVAWGDARGRAWFVAQYDPPPNLPPRLAAELLRAVSAMELASALDAERTAPKAQRRALQLEAVRVARRAGRAGDAARALVGYLFAHEHREVRNLGLRRIPRGFVRDTFIGGSIALTFVQWGLVRQLSYQVTLSVVWWPVVFVLASSVLAIAVLVIALGARPLTERGALVKQYLLGVRQYVVQTNFFDRATLTDALLPYAVLVVPARQAGREVATLVTRQLGTIAPKEGPTPWYVTPTQLLIRVFAPLAVIASIVVAAAVPAPYVSYPDYASYSDDLPGTDSWTVESAAFAAHLARSSDGHARLSATENLSITFEKNAADVPQFVQQWPAESNGQSLDLKVTSITVDQVPIPFSVKREQGTVLALTRMTDPLAGTHALVVHYSVDSAAVAADGNGGVVDRVSWNTLLEGWDSSSGWGISEKPISPLTVSVTMSHSLASLARRPSGWIGEQGTVPFGKTAAALRYDFGSATETTHTTATDTTHTLSLSQKDDGLYPTDLTDAGLGSVIEFPAGTFKGPDAGTLRSSQFLDLVPALASVSAGALALIIATLGIVAGARRRPWVFVGGAVRDLIQILGPALALSSVILFGWASAHLYGNEPQFVPMIVIALASIPAVIVGTLLTWRSRVPR